MITAELKVRYEGDWVDRIADYDVACIGVASTFRSRVFYGIVALDAAAAQFDEVVDTIRDNQFVRSLTVLEVDRSDPERVLGTVSLECVYPSYTPMQVLLLEGFLPIGYAEYRNGYEYLEILAEDREDVSEAVSALDYETVEVVRIVSSFETRPRPGVLEWQQLAESIPEGERELLGLAIERGYYDIPSGISLEALAAEAGVAKSTASRRLRNVERAVLPVLVKYLQLFSG